MGMRLLEFNRDDGGANPQQAVREQSRRKASVPPVERPRKTAHTAAELFANRKAKVFPVKTSTSRKPIRRGPIDLEQLQHRIAVLEQRIQTRAEQAGEHPAIKELALLKQRMKLLERNLENELWAARQREHTMLEILSQRPLKVNLLDSGGSSFRPPGVGCRPLPMSGGMITSRAGGRKSPRHGVSHWKRRVADSRQPDHPITLPVTRFTGRQYSLSP